MSIFVNDERIEDWQIAEEVERLRPDYVRTFLEQTPEEQEETLRKWAEENLIERILLFQEAQRRKLSISKNEVGRAFRNLVAKFGGPEGLYQSFGLSAKDKPAIRAQLQRQLAVKKLLSTIRTDSSDACDEKRDAFLQELKSQSTIRRDAPYRLPQKKLSSVLVKPAGPDCNLACSYCFYLEKAEFFPETKIHRMSEEILEEMVRQVVTQAEKQVFFTWQGGEPTLMGLSFYEKAVEFQQKYAEGVEVGNGFQTNGTLLNENWASFFRKNEFLVGLSLDGPQHVHDHYRFFRGGRGSWQQVVDRAKMLLDAGVKVNVLTVLSDYSAQFPEEIYNFHKSLGFQYMQFIPVVETNPHNPAEAAPFSVSPEAYGEFLKKIFDLWWADFKDGKPTTSVRYFDSVFFNYVGMEPPDCELKKACGVYVVVEHNGDVFSCDFFVEPKWKLGNVRENRIIDLLNSPRQFNFGQIKTVLPSECLNCPWLPYCWGGCPKDRLRDPRDKGSNHFCKSYKMFFEYADQRLTQLANQWRRQFLKA